MKIILLDTETTGFNEPQLLEAAWLELLNNLQPRDGSSMPICRRFKPNKKIEYGAMATHHILEEDLVDAISYTSFEIQDSGDNATEYLIGHNIDYDWAVIGKPNVKRICTLALARSCWPQIDSHSIGALMYFLKGPAARPLVQKAHSAADDCWMNYIILQELCDRLEIKTIEELYSKSEQARIPTVMAFGKYKGVAIHAVPRDYIQWYQRQSDTDPYLIKAFRLAGLL